MLRVKALNIVGDVAVRPDTKTPPLPPVLAAMKQAAVHAGPSLHDASGRHVYHDCHCLAAHGPHNKPATSPGTLSDPTPRPQKHVAGRSHLFGADLFGVQS